MSKVEREAGKLTIPLTSVMDRVAFLTGVSETTLYRLQRGDPDPIRKCPPKNFDLDDFDKEVVNGLQLISSDQRKSFQRLPTYVTNELCFKN